MKRVIFLLINCLSFFAGYSQNDQRLPAYGYEADRLRAVKTLEIPFVASLPVVNRRDSLYPQIIYVIADSSLYAFDPVRKKWDKVGTGTIGGGSTNDNLGSGYRIAVPGTNDIKTVYPGVGILVDSTTNSDAITFKIDTNYLKNNTTRNYSTIEQLRSVVGNAGDVARIDGYYTPGDGGHGLYAWRDTSTKAHTGVRWIRPYGHSGTGCWEIVLEGGVLNMLRAGCRPQFTGYFGGEGFDNRAKIIQAIEDVTEFTVFIYKYKTASLYFPASDKPYYVSDSVLITKNIKLYGDGPTKTILQFAADKPGFVLLFNSGSDYAADMELSFMSIQSTSYVGFNQNNNGIRSNTRFASHYVSVNAFGGHGWLIDAASPTNANLADLYYPSATNCRGNGFYFQGGDANQMRIYGLNSTNNYRWGVHDNSFLGNSYMSAHISENAYVAGNKTLVSHGGNWYGAYEPNINIEPGVTSGWQNYWQLLGAGAVNTYYTAWSNSENYVGGGSAYWSNPNQTSAIYDLYIEYGQNLVRSVGNNQFYGGVSTSQIVQGTVVGSFSNGYLAVSGLETITNTDNVRTRFIKSPAAIGFTDVSNGIADYGLYYYKPYKTILFGQASSPILQTGFASNGAGGSIIGRSSISPGHIVTKEIGFRKNPGVWEFRNLGLVDTIPTVGSAEEHAAGDFYLYNGQTEGIVGYRCVISGTPGTWETITSGNSITATSLGLGNVENTALSTWAGSSNITTLGTISTGSWNGTAIATGKGGAPSGGSTGQVLRKNSNTSYDYSWSTPTNTWQDALTASPDLSADVVSDVGNFNFEMFNANSFEFNAATFFNASAGSNNIDLSPDSLAINKKISYRTNINGSLNTPNSLVTKSLTDSLYKTPLANITDVGNVGTGVDDLMSYTVPAGALDTDGKYLEFTAVVTFAANSNNKTVRVVYGSTELYNSSAQPQNGGTMVIRGTIIRTGAATQDVDITVSTDAGLFTNLSKYTATTETLSGATTLKLTGEGTTNNDVLQKIFRHKF